MTIEEHPHLTAFAKQIHSAPATTFRSIDAWAQAGIPLGDAERHSMWRIGDWYIIDAKLFGRGACKRIVETDGWRGPNYAVCRTAASIARRFPELSRRLDTGFSHHQAVTRLSDDLALPLLEQAATEKWSQDKTRYEAARLLHLVPPTGGDVVADIGALIKSGKTTFRVILADPPWNVWKASGKRGASNRYYESMELADILALPVDRVADDRAFLFLWVPGALLPDGLAVMAQWGFSYTGNFAWVKIDGKPGTGYYVRWTHEHLLIGRGKNAPRHFVAGDIDSVIAAPRSAHSEKPAVVHEIIQRAAPGPYLELFGRKRIRGWTVVGDQLEKAVAAD